MWLLSLSEQSLRVYKKMLSEVYTNELKLLYIQEMNTI